MLPPHPPSMRLTRCSCVPRHPPLLYSQARCARVPLVWLHHSTRSTCVPPPPFSVVRGPLRPPPLSMRPDLLRPCGPRLPSPLDLTDLRSLGPALVLCRRAPRPATGCLPGLNRCNAHRSLTRANPSCYYASRFSCGYSTIPALVSAPATVSPSSSAPPPPYHHGPFICHSYHLPGPYRCLYRSLKLTCFLSSRAWGVV